jgi:GrpB-like predicted nucleotidyltransferase (UPF0157 family)
MDRSERNDHLDQVLVGGRERRRVVIVDYDPGWPLRFEAERDRIRRSLGVRALRIEHIGSTSVPGLGAKPIVDVLVTVVDADDEREFREPLERAGYVLRVREPCHRMFRTPARDVQVHIWSDDDAEVERHLRFVIACAARTRTARPTSSSSASWQGASGMT